MSSPLQSSLPSPRWYRVFGRTIESFVDLPATPIAEGDDADWLFRLGDPVAEGVGERDDDAVVRSPDASAEVYEARGFARFVVGEREITVHPRPDIQPADLVVPMTGSFSAVLLARAGHLVLHGTTLQSGDGCYVLCGNAGAGKSTQAAYLVQQGWRLVADDVSAIAWSEAGPRVLRGFGGLRLFPESLALLGLNPSDFPSLHPRTTKRQVLAESLGLGRAVGDSVPLKGIVVLESSEEAALTRLPERNALVTLLNFQHPAAAGVANRSEAARQKVFMEAARLAGAAPAYRLGRPRSATALGEVHRLLAEQG